MISHKTKFGVYHWDTFDNETLLMKECKTLDAAHKFIKEYYGDRIRGNGADRVDVVDDAGNVVERYNVG